MTPSRHDKTIAHRSGTAPVASTRPKEIDGSSSGPLFTTDRRGDVQNVTYGSLDKYKISRYHAAGYGRLLGLDRRFRITHTSDAKRDVQDDSNDVTRQNTRKALSLLNSRVSDHTNHVDSPIRSDRRDVAFSNQQSYISLDSSRNRKRRKLSPSVDPQESDAPLVVHEVNTDSGDVSTSEPDIDVEHRTAQDAFEKFRNHPDNIRQIELSRRVDTDPLDGDAWIELINHQERFYIMSTWENAETLSPPAQHAVTDIRLSLYEKALTKVTDVTARESLLIGLMQEGTGSWDTAKLLEKWKAVLRQNSSIRLWMQYLNLQQANAVVFSYDQCLEIYSSIIGITRISHDQDRALHFCYLILRLTTFMHQAGYTERAVAIWQALIELNFFRPTSTHPDTIFGVFERFWDSEVARVGETNAKGWNGHHVEVDPSIDEPYPSMQKADILRSWANAEICRSSNDVLPARTLDDTLEDDAFRIIIWSDIKNFLLIIEDDGGRRALLQAYLQFIGLPPLDHGLEQCRSWWTDIFLCQYRTAQIADRSSTIPYFVPDLHTTFPSSDWFTTWEDVAHINPVLLRFAIRALTQLVESNPTNDQLAIHLVALRFSRDPTAARKYAKSLLKKRSENLLIYNAYALMEARSGKIEAAMNVWSAALSMVPSLGPEKQKGAVILWHSLAWVLVTEGRWPQAKHVLVAAIPRGATDQFNTTMGQANSYNASNYLKAGAFYRNHITDALTSSDHQTVPAYTDLLAMLKYCTNDHTLEPALLVYDTTLTALAASNHHSESTLVERIHQSRARLIHNHTKAFPTGYRPIQILSYLQQSHSLFPDNAIIFQLHDRFSQRAGRVDRLRNVTKAASTPPPNDSQSPRKKDDLTNSTPPSLLHNLTVELSRPPHAGATEHSVRSAFTRAMTRSRPPTHNSSPSLYPIPNPTLHTSRLTWDLSLLPPSQISTDPKLKSKLHALKQTYLSALRSCPWSKSLYLLPFTHETLAVSLGATEEKRLEECGELREVYRGMVERGVRVRVDVGDLL